MAPTISPKMQAILNDMQDARSAFDLAMKTISKEDAQTMLEVYEHMGIPQSDRDSCVGPQIVEAFSYRLAKLREVIDGE